MSQCPPAPANNEAMMPLADSLKFIFRSPRHLCFSVLLAIIAAVVVALPSWPHLGWGLIVVTDVYLVLLLWCASIQSAHRRETWPRLPYRESAVFVLPMVFIALVLAFAALLRNYTHGHLTYLGATYVSLINFGSFTYDASEATSHTLRFTIAAQLLNGILLLICALPLLVSRLTDLDSPATANAQELTDINLCLDGKSLTIAEVRVVNSSQGPRLLVRLKQSEKTSPPAT
jgi:hypothetical protein